MTIPAIIFGLLISSFIGAVFHLVKGGGVLRLLIYILISWVGFWSGHMIASILNINFINLGPIHLGTSIVANILILFVGYWLSLVQLDKGK